MRRQQAKACGGLGGIKLSAAARRSLPSRRCGARAVTPPTPPPSLFPCSLPLLSPLARPPHLKRALCSLKVPRVPLVAVAHVQHDRRRLRCQHRGPLGRGDGSRARGRVCDGQRRHASGQRDEVGAVLEAEFREHVVGGGVHRVSQALPAGRGQSGGRSQGGQGREGLGLPAGRTGRRCCCSCCCCCRSGTGRVPKLSLHRTEGAGRLPHHPPTHAHPHPPTPARARPP